MWREWARSAGAPQAAFFKFRSPLNADAGQAPFPHACNPHFHKLIVRPRPRNARVQVIAGHRTRPRPARIFAAAIQSEDPRTVSDPRGLKRGFLFFAERPQFARPPRNRLFRNLIAQIRRRVLEYDLADRL